MAAGARGGRTTAAAATENAGAVIPPPDSGVVLSAALDSGVLRELCECVEAIDLSVV